MGPTEILANYVARAKLADFPEKVVLQAKHLTQDAIGCALGGAQTELGLRHIAALKDMGGGTQATIIGDGVKTSAVFAAHTNTELGNTLDFDDIHWLTLAHPGSPTVFSALAAGEMAHASGKEILTGVLAGYEVGLRVGRAIRSIVALPDGKKEVLSNPAYLIYCSVAAACKVLGMNAAETENAFGIVGATPVNRGQSRVHMGQMPTAPYTDNKYDLGIYALLGVFSAVRGRKISGPKGILDGDRYWKGAGANSYDASELTKDLGKEYRVMEMAFKSASSCGCTEAPVSAVREALKGERLRAEDIEEIKLVGLPRLLYYNWDTLVEAEFSTPCAVALAVVGQEPGPDAYNTGRYKEPDIYEIARKVTFTEDPRARELNLKCGQWICTAEIKTRDGKVRMAHIDFEKGAPENPMTELEIHHKFTCNAQGILGEKRAEELWDTLLHLEKIKNAAALAAKLSK